MASTVSLRNNISSPPLKWSAATSSSYSSDGRQTITLSLRDKKKDDRVNSDATNQNPVAKISKEEEPIPLSGDEKKKRKFSTFSVSLTREKIEADLIAMGGSKRSKRASKKRPKNVQKQLDDLFPGLRLKYITPDDYKVRAS